MITQNPIIGRSRKKLAGVYARTLWGMNIIQSLPSPSSKPPTKALRDNRSAFAVVQQMANMVPPSLLPSLYYDKPVGRSRRHLISSDINTGVVHVDKEVSFDLTAFTRLGTNPIVTSNTVIHTATDKNFTMPKAMFDATDIADTTRQPCLFALSYEAAVCVPLLDYATLDGDNIVFQNVSDTFVGLSAAYVCLWQVNVGTEQYPVWVYGSYRRNL